MPSRSIRKSRRHSEKVQIGGVEESRLMERLKVEEEDRTNRKEMDAGDEEVTPNIKGRKREILIKTKATVFAQELRILGDQSGISSV